MEFEFDKEMDALLRQTAKGEASAFATKNPQLGHLDVDEISAFAENVLPNKARVRATKHLADCDSCRISLSNLIVLNSEAASSEAASDSSNETETASVEIPWYQKLFGFQNLAYGLGALVILFAGFTAYIVFQNVNNSATGGDIARQSENINGVPSQTNSASSDSSAETANTDIAEANLTVANSAPNTAENDLSDVAEKAPPESTILNEQQDAPADGKTTSDRRNDEIGLSKNKPRSIGTPKTGNYIESSPPPKPGRVIEESAEISGADAEGKENLKVTRTEDNKRDTSPITVRKGEKIDDKVNRENKPEARKKDEDDSRSSSGRQVGGKTFTRKNGVWVDTAYKNQKTTDVRRNTSQYRNLDSGLRKITDELGGTVVVVWKTKAYKIQ